MFKTNFPGHNKFFLVKIFGGHCPRMSFRDYGPEQNYNNDYVSETNVSRGTTPQRFQLNDKLSNQLPFALTASHK